MEFRRREMSQGSGGADDYSIRLLNWPDSYYRERDAKVRRAILDAACEAGLTPEDNEIRREIYLRRYAAGGAKDLFLKAWIDMAYLANSDGGLFFRKYDPKRVRRILDSIGLNDLRDRRYSSLMSEELIHMAMLYAALCEEDKTFGSVLLGMGRMSNEALRRKIRADFRKVALEIPEKYGVADEYRIWSLAIETAFDMAYPDMAGTLKAQD